MRKFVFSPAVVGSAIAAIGMVRKTATGPRDWRLTLSWLGWGLSAAIAVGTVLEKSKDAATRQAEHEAARDRR